MSTKRSETPKERRDREALAELEWGLPHLFAFKWYFWAREFFESRSKLNFLCAANQISKSSTQIRKCVEWATNKSLWPHLWPGKAPNQFWYLYPSQKQVNAEFKTKWQEFLPRGRFKNDPKYGWKVIKEGPNVIGIDFFSGITLYFKTYTQKESALQTGTVYSLFCDEELPVELYHELMFRITSTDGYFHMVFTATIGQDFWRRVLEPDDDEPEALPGAWKRQVSLYDAMEYEDGSPGAFNMDKIQIIINRCPTHEEILRRVDGKFITSLEGRKYPSFDRKRHYVTPHRIPEDWEIWVGVDVGSGGDGHPAAIMFLAVEPKFTRAVFFAGWRGDNIGNTIAADVMDKYLQICHERKLKPTRKIYDQGCRDFKTISDRIRAGFEGAEKHHDVGDDILNLLFKYDMVTIFDGDEELAKFGREITTIKKATPKNKRKDDMVDAGRYAMTLVPWDLDRLNQVHVIPLPPMKEETYAEACVRERTERAKRPVNTEEAELQAEFNELNAMYSGEDGGY